MTARRQGAGAHVTAIGRDPVIEHVAANGGADIIVHVAGGGASAPSGGFAALTQELWHHMLQLNLLGAVRPDGETRTRTGDTTIFSPGSEPF